MLEGRGFDCRWGHCIFLSIYLITILITAIYFSSCCIFVKTHRNLKWRILQPFRSSVPFTDGWHPKKMQAAVFNQFGIKWRMPMSTYIPFVYEHYTLHRRYEGTQENYWHLYVTKLGIHFRIRSLYAHGCTRLSIYSSKIFPSVFWQIFYTFMGYNMDSDITTMSSMPELSNIGSFCDIIMAECSCEAVEPNKKLSGFQSACEL
jgi:hypothetical protein